MKKLAFCYITFANEKQAKSTAKKLLKEKLIVCANIIPKIKSIYYWKRKMTEETETVMICKLLKEKSKAVEEKIKKMHSYEIPFVGFIELKKVNKEYMEWAARKNSGKN